MMYWAMMVIEVTILFYRDVREKSVLFEPGTAETRSGTDLNSCDN
jgi:hypothetical protein